VRSIHNPQKGGTDQLKQALPTYSSHPTAASEKVASTAKQCYFCTLESDEVTLLLSWLISKQWRLSQIIKTLKSFMMYTGNIIRLTDYIV